MLICLKRDFQNEAVKGLNEVCEQTERMATSAVLNGPVPVSAASSDQISMEYEITSVDEDILHTVEKLFTFGRSGAIPYDTIQDILGKAIQAERNHWKERLHSAMQEIERQHKIILNEQSSLQSLVKMCSGEKERSNKGKEETIQEENLTTEQLIENLKFKIEHLKHVASLMDGHKEIGNIGDKINSKKKYSEMDIRFMKNAIAKIHFEKESLQNKINEKEKENKWLQNELNSVKSQLLKLQDIVKEYNEDHQGAKFHLDEVEGSPKHSSQNKSARIPKERTYIEGDQLQSFPVPGEETAMWKLRLRSQIYSTRKGNTRTGVAQCLRCQKLFKPNENSPKACRFHNKGREIKEQYDDNGKLLQVVYKWACCKKGLDTVGCSTGYHI